MKNNNNMVYFILALMCILIGGQFLQTFSYSYTSARMLIGLGVFILLVIGIKSVHYVLTYPLSEVKEPEIEEFEKEE